MLVTEPDKAVRSRGTARPNRRVKRFSSFVRPDPAHVAQICDEVTDCLRTWGEAPAVVARARRVVAVLLSRADPARAVRFDLAHRAGQVDLRVTESDSMRRTALATPSA